MNEHNGRVNIMEYLKRKEESFETKSNQHRDKRRECLLCAFLGTVQDCDYRH